MLGGRQGPGAFLCILACAAHRTHLLCVCAEVRPLAIMQCMHEIAETDMCVSLLTVHHCPMRHSPYYCLTQESWNCHCNGMMQLLTLMLYTHATLLACGAADHEDRQPHSGQATTLLQCAGGQPGPAGGADNLRCPGASLLALSLASCCMELSISLTLLGVVWPAWPRRWACGSRGLSRLAPFGLVKHR